MTQEDLDMLNLPIAGAVFRPPAKEILAALPYETALMLTREPENPHDSNAVKVVLYGFTAENYPELFSDLDARSVPDEFEAGKGAWNKSQLQSQMHLGYVSAKTGHAAWLAKWMDGEGLQSIPAKLSGGMTGQPVARLEPEELKNLEPEEPRVGRASAPLG